MTARTLAIIGGGEHARVVADAARSGSDPWRVLGIVDPAPVSAPGADLAELGDDDVFAARLRSMDAADRPMLVLGVGGDVAIRRRLKDRFAGLGSWATVVHAAAWVSPTATVEAGAVVLGGAIVNTGTRIGAHAIVNSGAIVEHDVVVGGFAHVGPGAVVGGGASIGDGAFVGLGARVRDHVDVGPDAIVGMGAVVVADVPGRSMVIGVPARVTRTVDA